MVRSRPRRIGREEDALVDFREEASHDAPETVVDEKNRLRRWSEALITNENFPSRATVVDGKKGYEAGPRR